MKRGPVWMGAVIGLWAFAGAVPPSTAAPPPGYYLVWDDEFNGTALDTSKWDYWLSGNRRDAVNISGAVAVGGGNLTITTFTYNGTNYTGMIATDQTFRSCYGYWEARIKWGDTNGMWSAFWMQSPTMGAYLDDPAVAGSEMDIVEHRRVDSSGNYIANQVQNNIHWNGYGSAARSAGSGNLGSGLATGFHTYGFLWTPGVYTLYVDGNNLRSWNLANNGVPISHSTEWTILSSEVDDTSTTWAGYIPAGGYGSLASSTTKMMVDYVRYYAPTNTIFWTGTGSVDWTNAANWVANRTPGPGVDVTYSYLSANLASDLGQDYAVDGLVFLNLKNGASLSGSHTLTVGADGIDMTAANHTVNLNCPVHVGAAQTWQVGPNNPGNTLYVNGSLSGAATLSKAGHGTVVLRGINSFSGTLNVDTGSTYADDGTLRIANPAAVAHVASPIAIRNNNGGSSTLQLDGSLGSLTIAQAINLSGRNTNVVAIENLAGNNTISGNLNLVVGGGNYWIQSDSSTLTFSGAVPAITPGGARTLTFMGNGNIALTGPLQNGAGGGTVNVVKSGTGYLTLASPYNSLSGELTIAAGTLQVGNGLSDGTLGAATVVNQSALVFNITGSVKIANSISGGGALTKNNGGRVTLSGRNSYTGATRLNDGSLLVDGVLGSTAVTVTGGTLGGEGVIHGPVTIQAGGTLAPGSSPGAIGVLTLSNDLVLEGTVVMEVDAATATNDVVRGLNRVSFGGALVITNLAGTLRAGDRFKIFEAADYSGRFASVSLPPLETGLAWNTNSLTNGELSVELGAVTPRVSALWLAGTNLLLSGSGGAAGYSYSVLSSTNLGTPLPDWEMVGTGVFDPEGGFLFTNPVSPMSPRRFLDFRIP